MVARGKPAGLSEPSQFQVTLQLVEGLAGSEPGPDADGRTRPISKRNKLRQAETANQNTVLTERRVWGSPAPRPPACWACERGRTSQLRPQYSIFLFFQSGGEKCPQLKPHPFPRVPPKAKLFTEGRILSIQIYCLKHTEALVSYSHPCFQREPPLYPECPCLPNPVSVLHCICESRL